NSGLTDLDIQALAVSPAFASDRTLWAGTNGGGIFKSGDGGATWSAASSGLPNLDVRALAVSPNVVADRTLLAGTYGSSVFCSTNGGSSWSAVNIASKFYDKGYVNWLEVSYYASFVAEGNVLAFSPNAAGLYEVTGFTSNDIEVYDVSDMTHVQRLVNTTVAGGTVRFSAASASRILALTPAAWLTPLGLAEVTYPTSPYTPADLLDTANGADYILISHADFWPQALRLASYRAADFRVALIAVQQIYDQFNGGLMSAEAIRDFLQYAYDHWQAPRPAFVLLLGDGTYDMRQYLGNSAPTYIPPFLALVDGKVNGETAADNRFVTVAGDDIMPDMHIGRLPANSLAEAEAMVDKIIAYELGCACGPWSQHVLFVADDLEGGGGNFYAYSNGLADGYADPPANTIKYLPEPYTSTKVYLGPPPDGTCDTPAACSAEITHTLNTTGALLTSYIGHSLKTVWGAEDRLLDQAALSTLESRSCLPIMLAMTCETGFFHEPQLGFSSLGEAAVREPGRGAVAYWGAAGSGLASGQDFLEKGFFLALFHGGADRVGVAVTEGKRYLLENTPPGNYDNLVDMFTLFGDPALKVKVGNNCGDSAIGDFVWWDINGNGQQDPGEPGIPGVDVVLSDNLLVSTTDANGFYTFANVPAGMYTLKIGDTEFQPGGTLYNWLASPRAAAAPDLDSDGDEVAHVADVILQPGEVNRATDFGFRIPSSYVLAQELNTQEAVRPGDLLSFTIRIVNTGATTITHLPLRYVYDNAYLSYVSAAPAPDDAGDDGMIEWSDLTAGFGQDLAPGADITVVIAFKAVMDTTSLPGDQTVNTARVDGARADPDGAGPLAALEQLPEQEASAGVQILNPTGLTLAALSGVARPDGVLIAWETASELPIVGFNILRREAGGEWQRVNEEFIFAARAGANEGATYTYQDKQVTAGTTYEYMLETVKSDGSVEQSGPAWVTIGWWAMLPLIMEG
ncbi:MAG: C25 family cysteine peptidase, partial [Anaerolineae bacterium]|nr:C25 family cysteine peptidase [Anaerolineae bacterium]